MERAINMNNLLLKEGFICWSDKIIESIPHKLIVLYEQTNNWSQNLQEKFIHNEDESKDDFPYCLFKHRFKENYSLRGRRLKGKGKAVLGKGVLGARETRGAREEVSLPPSSLARGLAP